MAPKYVEPDTVAPVDGNWSYGFLGDPGTVASFGVDSHAEKDRYPLLTS